MGGPKDSRSAQVFYQPIKKSQIRLVQISRDDHGFINCKLRVVSLKPRPKFTAVSYVCGTEDNPREILLDRRPFEVYQNLYPLLRLIAKHEESSARPSWYWIDSICINHTDSEERSAQVTNMDEIYACARSTIIWLGDATGRQTKEVADAFSFLHELGEKCYRRKGESRREDKYLIDAVRGRWSDWLALEKLLSKDWFRRAWTLQEMVLSREYEFKCGKHGISMKQWKRAIYAAFLCRCYDGLIKRDVWDSTWNRRRICLTYKARPMPLVSVLAYMGDHRATNHRDHIYSALGMIPQVDVDMVGEPDYRAERDAVFIRLVKSFVVTHDNLDIICFAHDFKPLSRSARSLPSWVPDWSVDHVRITPVPYLVSQGSMGHIGNFRPITSPESPARYRASGGRPPRITGFSRNSRELTCEGIFLDTIDGLGALTDVELQPSTSTLNTRSNHDITIVNTFSMLLDIARCLVVDRADRYLCNVAPAHFSSDFLAACIAATYFPSQVCDDFLNWFERNKNLRMYGTSLKEIVQKVKLLPQSDKPSLRATFDEAKVKVKLRHAHLPELVDTDDDWKTFIAVSRNTTVNLRRRLMVTRRGLLGMAPAHARKGDVVCVLFGCNVPVVLREMRGDNNKRRKYEFVGEAYVHDYMNGEAVKEMELGKAWPENFRLV